MEAVEAWAAQLYPRAFKDPQVAAAMLQSLQLRSDNPQAALLRAVAFVQGQIRDVGLDMGENSHAPHAPEVTLRKRYGDCKDKATLWIALLQRAGIRAEPVLVNSYKGYGLDARLPSPCAFGRSVSAISSLCSSTTPRSRRSACPASTMPMRAMCARTKPIAWSGRPTKATSSASRCFSSRVDGCLAENGTQGALALGWPQLARQTVRVQTDPVLRVKPEE